MDNYDCQNYDDDPSKVSDFEFLHVCEKEDVGNVLTIISGLVKEKPWNKLRLANDIKSPSSFLAAKSI